MSESVSWSRVHEVAVANAWRLEDVLPPDARFDVGLPFLPDGLARTGALAEELEPRDRRLLNHVRAHGYLSMFGVVEGFILPFVLDHARPAAAGDDRTRALLQFASEEAKHIALFERFRGAFRAQLGLECPLVTTPAALAEAVLAQPPLTVALLTLHIEWMTQRHFVESVKGDGTLDPLFKSLLDHHWREESRHGLLDELLVQELAAGLDAGAIAAALASLEAVLTQLGSALDAQVDLDLDAFGGARGRALDPDVAERVRTVQRRALRWTFIGSGLTHPRFARSLRALHPEGQQWLDRQVAALA